jgi:SpoVK/Ycf46/Vps4 family AAA+-type ATPase
LERPFGENLLRLEGVCPKEGLISAVLADVRLAMRERNVYRGQVISLHGGEDRQITVGFHHLPQITRDGVVLPAGTIERLERHAMGVAAQAQRLRAAGRQLKRGILLHGPPGTGKTLTVNYLLGAMPGRSTVLLTGRSLGLIEPAVAIARELTPATVVLEDVDLVATERTMTTAHTGILFELLNQMEGLEQDADLLFLLTTNRADLIEPALATRPGRVDLALEVPLPDDSDRTRLVKLYAEDVPLDAPTEQDLVARTDGLTGAFIKELMRQASLRAALEERIPTSADARSARHSPADYSAKARTPPRQYRLAPHRSPRCSMHSPQPEFPYPTSTSRSDPEVGRLTRGATIRGPNFRRSNGRAPHPRRRDRVDALHRFRRRRAIPSLLHRGARRRNGPLGRAVGRCAR